MRHNRAFGRAICSKIDLDVYCPAEVLQQSGPLFGDLEGIKAEVDEFISNKMLDIRVQCKCVICGFPDCTCHVCSLLASQLGAPVKSKATTSHECALQYASLGAPSKNGHYDLEQTSQLKAAWAQKLVFEMPKYVKAKSASGYYWPEELE